MMRLLLLLATVLAMPFVAQAQEVELFEDVAADSLPDTYGPNERHYAHFYTGFGFVVGPGEGDSLRVLAGPSYEILTGLRYKLKVTGWYAVGLDLSYRNVRYRIEQDSSKNFPNTNLHKREALVDNSFNLAFYNRFNLGQRGNVLGKFVDVGVYGSYGFAFRHRYLNREESANGDGAKVSRVVNRQLNYTNAVNYGVKASIGSDVVSIFGMYRLSNLLKESRGYGELPRLTIGIEIAAQN